ncbi:Indolepyruvate oxidoreductase subunit IorA [uncultured Desulfatiglans sp.]|uniref:Indolepyruvate oxidoreductase subunit IorA n=1 Tax=Uncultured Desulfatiglans sp. TaxID=1748965 RepID=A0A653A4U4_UNCDX|nr:Indolepyruvate oxidoreductase subunit IorA [uncultured Desulfatiglans sp.]
MTTRSEFLLGNGAIALGLLEAGCQVLTSYPGTPSSEILPETVRLMQSEGIHAYTEWSTNEKVALDTAYAAAVAGKRAACCMKQVGLNVAADSLMSSAYLGVTGALVIISCDDPGPHSSQTEQDTRFMARLAKVPVFDPSSPEEARQMVKAAMDLSAEFRLPVILRPAIRVCHARQNMTWGPIASDTGKAAFERNPLRWAATPKFRLKLHGELNQKLEAIQERFEAFAPFNAGAAAPPARVPLGIVAGGVPSAAVADLLAEEGLSDIPILKLGAPFPFPYKSADVFMDRCDRVLVLEETDTFIEYLLGDRKKVLGRLSGHVPAEGELVPERIAAILDKTLNEAGLQPLSSGPDLGVRALVEGLGLPMRRPTLCPGCPHRASFFAIRKAQPKAIFTSDIGCYTLGLNLGAVDTCLDMGAGITMAAGFYHAFAADGETQPVVATIGDSTFFHSGTAGLINAVYNNARFVLVILDNEITAMTGMQPTPGLGLRADGTRGKAVSIERVVEGCGIEFLRVVDPYALAEMTRAVKEAASYTLEPDGGIAVIIARHPCVIAYRKEAIPVRRTVTVTDDCVECRLCLERFECPALYHDEALGKTAVNQALCTGCGVCIQVCPKGAIKEV